MHFLYPNFLWALLAVLIPIIIHLFYFRRYKTVYFTNVKLLKEIKEETANRRKLKNLLILLARCLTIICLVLAFCQPFIPTQKTIKQGINIVSVFIDNSFSMQAKRVDIPLLDIAKDKATNIITAYGEEDKFQILTNDFEGKHLRLVSKQDALNYIKEIDVSPSFQTLQNVLHRQSQIISQQNGNKISYIISDFQKTSFEFNNQVDTSFEINLVPIQTEEIKNVAVDSVWFEGPTPVINQSNKLLVKIKNYSNQAVEQVKASITIDGQEKPIGLHDINAKSEIVDTFLYNVVRSGWEEAIIKVSDYPVEFDDDYHIAFNVPDTIRVLSLNQNGSNKYVDAFFKGIKNFTIDNQSVSQINFQKFKSYNLIIVNEIEEMSSGLSSELANYTRNGGNLIIFPNVNVKPKEYDNLLNQLQINTLQEISNVKREVSSINTKEYIFRDVYLESKLNMRFPVSLQSFTFNNVSKLYEDKLMTYRDGSSFLSKFGVGSGYAYLCASGLNQNYNDLVLNAEIFVPLLYKAAISKNSQNTLSYTIQNVITIPIENKGQREEKIYKISGQSEFIPAQLPNGNITNLIIQNQKLLSGFYNITLGDDVEGKFALHYNRRESDLQVWKEIELDENASKYPNIKLIDNTSQNNIREAVVTKDNGVVLWKWFLIAALLFLGIESLLLRMLKS